MMGLMGWVRMAYEYAQGAFSFSLLETRIILLPMNLHPAFTMIAEYMPMALESIASHLTPFIHHCKCVTP
jgi:hypothetical protein